MLQTDERMRMLLERFPTGVLLEDEHAGQLLLPEDELASGYRTELEEASGRTLEIEWLPIRHDQRNLGHAWFIKDVSARRRKEQELQNVARIIQNSLRKGDHTGRLGGEEFAVLLPSATGDEALMLAERIRRQLEEAITETPEATIAVTISIGVALLYGHSIDSVQEAADKALYQAKHNGRNQVSLAQ